MSRFQTAPRSEIYTIPFCGSGLTPFSPQCPGELQQQSWSAELFSALKRQNLVSGLHVPVSNVNGSESLSARQLGLDVNERTRRESGSDQRGKNPALDQQPRLSRQSKAGLWAWIIGNVVTGARRQPPTGHSTAPAPRLRTAKPRILVRSAATPSCIACPACMAGILAFISSFFVIK